MLLYSSLNHFVRGDRVRWNVAMARLANSAQLENEVPSKWKTHDTRREYKHRALRE